VIPVAALLLTLVMARIGSPDPSIAWMGIRVDWTDLLVIAAIYVVTRPLAIIRMLQEPPASDFPCSFGKGCELRRGNPGRTSQRPGVPRSIEVV
jgi:hypothetical protein